MDILKNLLSGGAANLVSSVGKALDDVITSKEEKLHYDLELKKAEMQYTTDVKKLAVEEKKLVLADVGSARQMATAVQTSTAAPWLVKNISPLLAVLTTLITFVLFYLIIFRDDTKAIKENKEIVLYILGALSAIVTQIFSFYFGSSTGSSTKNDMLQRQLDFHMQNSRPQPK